MNMNDIMGMVLNGGINEFDGYIHLGKTWHLTIYWNDAMEGYNITLKEVDKPAEVKFV